MKWIIASDLHGSAHYCRQLLEAWKREEAPRMLFLGDLLYHGPRNDLPEGYAPKEVIALLQERQADIFCVRGNCEAEVDQMVLDFPCMGDYAQLVDDAGRTLFFTHGHIFGAGFQNSVDNLPALLADSALVYGHTHVKVNEPVPERPDIWAFNPGSVGIPKDGSHSFGIYESGKPLAEAFRHVVLKEA